MNIVQVLSRGKSAVSAVWTGDNGHNRPMVNRYNGDVCKAVGEAMASGIPNSANMRSQPRQARSQERVNQILDAAEDLFISKGYEATKMRALAQAARVPIGSIYQFFKDKLEILQALHVRYLEFFKQRLDALDKEMMVQLPLPDYVDQIVDFCNQFLIDYPGYYAIFTQIQGLPPGWQKLEDSIDAEILRDWAIELNQRDPSLTKKDCEAISFVLLKTIDNLLWLAQGQDTEFRNRLVNEAKRFTLSYLQSYIHNPHKR